MGSDVTTKRLDCRDGVDRISNLPGNLIDLIVKRLPLSDAARMSILSKTWRDIWVMHPYLVFDSDFFTHLRLARTMGQDEVTRLAEVSRTISGILLAHSGPILKFHLEFPYDMPLHEYSDTIVWIKSLSKSGVRKLKLENYAESNFKIPSYLYFCSDLAHLRLTGCILNPPLKFKGFSNLISVVLVHVIITADMSFGSQLGDLHLECCTGIEHLGRQFKYYNNLTVLSIRECGGLESQWFECMQKVGVLCLYLDRKAEKMIKLDELVGKMPRIHTLYLDSFFLESLEPGAAAVMKTHLTMENLQYLYLFHVEFCNLVQIQYVLCLLRISPNLKYLHMVPEPERNDMNLAESRELMVSSVEQYLQLQNLIGMTLKLEVVEMCTGFSSAELQFIKLLLGFSPSLRWMKFFDIPVVDPREQFRISQELMRFPRASTAAQIIWT